MSKREDSQQNAITEDIKTLNDLPDNDNSKVETEQKRFFENMKDKDKEQEPLINWFDFGKEKYKEEIEIDKEFETNT